MNEDITMGETNKATGAWTRPEINRLGVLRDVAKATGSEGNGAGKGTQLPS